MTKSVLGSAWLQRGKPWFAPRDRFEPAAGSGEGDGRDGAAEDTSPRRWVIVSAPCEFDIATADRFRKKVLRGLATAPYLIVDLSNVEFIDSTGLGTLLAAHCHAAGLGGGLAVVGPGVQAQKLFSMTKVDELIPCYESFDQVPASGYGWGSSSS